MKRHAWILTTHDCDRALDQLRRLAQTGDPASGSIEARCVGCHGDDGTGGGHGPAIVDMREPRATTREAVRDADPERHSRARHAGFPDPDEEAGAIAAYVMRLKAAGGRRRQRRQPRGRYGGRRTVLRRKGELRQLPYGARPRAASSARIFRTLAATASRRRSSRRCAIPAACAPAAGRGGRGGRGAPSYQAVTVRLRNGQTLRGIAKNESAFDLQLLAHGRQAASAAEGPGGRSDPRKIADAEGRSAPGRDAQPGRLPEPPELRARRQTTRRPAASPGAGISFADMAHPKPGAWPTYDGNMSGNRFSPLNQINTANVERLAPKWMFPVPGRAARARGDAGGGGRRDVRDVGE